MSRSKTRGRLVLYKRQTAREKIKRPIAKRKDSGARAVQVTKGNMAGETASADMLMRKEELTISWTGFPRMKV